MLLYPPGSAWAFMPASLNLPPPSNATLVMDNCTISTLCDTLEAYAQFINGTMGEQGGPGVRVESFHSHTCRLSCFYNPMNGEDLTYRYQTAVCCLYARTA